MYPQISIFSQTAQLYQTLTRLWFKIAQDAITKNGCFTVALSGGKTPRSFYQYLSKYKKRSVWKNTHLFIVDERFVSRTSKENNGKMIRESLLNQIKIPASHIHFVDTHKKTARACAEHYEHELKNFFNGPPKFDLVLLGIGEDGHTASLFPASKALKEKRAVVATLKPGGTQGRISLSVPAIKNARNVFFLVTGKNKATIINTVLNGRSRLPAALVFPRKGEGKFFLDHAAAGER